MPTSRMAADLRSHQQLLRSALRLSMASVAFGTLVGLGALVIGVTTRSLALVGFAVDAIIDLSASILLIHRFQAESRGRHGTPRLERRAVGFISVLLVLAGFYVAVQSLLALAAGAHPERTPAGLGISAASVVVLPWLALRKAQVATRLPSRALRADAFLTGMGCVLAGLALVSALLDLAGGAGRADAAAALVIGVVLAGEGIRGIFRFATKRD